MSWFGHGCPVLDQPCLPYYSYEEMCIVLPRLSVTSIVRGPTANLVTVVWFIFNLEQSVNTFYKGQRISDSVTQSLIVS
jgi:hypothetical protein